VTNISHLQHKGQSICCIGCGHEFELSRHDLADPHRLVVKKERIAEKHICRTRKSKILPIVRAWRHPANEDLGKYYDSAVRRLMPA
jgi:hypothetical protein